MRRKKENSAKFNDLSPTFWFRVSGHVRTRFVRLRFTATTSSNFVEMDPPFPSFRLYFISLRPSPGKSGPALLSGCCLGWVGALWLYYSVSIYARKSSAPQFFSRKKISVEKEMPRIWATAEAEAGLIGLGKPGWVTAILEQKRIKEGLPQISSQFSSIGDIWETRVLR